MKRSCWKVESERQVAYRVELVDDLLDPANHQLRNALKLDGSPSHRLVVSDRLVWSLYGKDVLRYLSAHNAECQVQLLDTGEKKKGLEQALAVVAACDAAGVQRRATPVLAFGGGVVLDIAGFAASLYRRGVPYVRIPTSLVGMIDAGIGSKVGVNYLGKKSAIGAFHPPHEVLVDPAFLRSLDHTGIASGLSEAIKIALVCDADLFQLIEADVDVLSSTFLSGASHQAVLTRSISAMLGQLEDNLWEEHLNRLPDFGHTFSPGIEMATSPMISHGEAVALDMTLSALLSVRRELLELDEFERISRVIEAAGLPVDHEAVTPELLADSLEWTVRHRDGLQRAPLLTGIGRSCFVNDIDAGELKRILAELRERLSIS
jgi:2-epi-5-epi-valiolone synthase